MTEKDNRSFETIVAEAGSIKDGANPVAQPLYLSACYRHPDLDQAVNFDRLQGFTYSRVETPNRKTVEETLAKLEEGYQGFAVASGMAAVQLVLSVLKTGDEVVSLDDLYGGDFRYFRHLEDHFQIKFKLWNGKALEKLQELLSPKTKLVWLETPSNPMMKSVDIRAVADAVHDYKPDILVAVDNTFYTPYYQKPLTQGADVVIHSATKYLGGHNDILGGIVVVKDPALADFYFQYTITVGDTMSAFDSWLLTRSLKTLPLRMQQHTASAKKIVSFLEQAPHVEKVLYPGKAGMISFYLDSDEEVDRVLKSVKLITFAESLGGAESLLTIPYYQTHDDVEEDQRLRLGITPRLLRLSVGLENADDLIADLAQAFGE